MALDEEALQQALIMAGLGIMGGRGDAFSKLAQGGMFGMQGYNSVLAAREAAKLQQAKLLEEAQQAQQREMAMKQAQAKQDVLTRYMGQANAQPAGSQPSMADAPGWTPQVPPAKRKSYAQMLYDAGFIDDAKKAAEVEKSFQDEFSTDVRVGNDGRPYLVSKTGQIKQLDRALTPREKAHFADNGATIVPLDPYTGQPVGTAIPKQMSPEGADSSRRGWAQFGLDKARFDRGDLREGPVPGGTALGWVTQSGFNPVPGTTVKAPDLPGSIIENIAKNDVAITKINAALAEVRNRPESFGGKNYLGDAVRQRTDEEGIRGRALVADIGSQKLHDRSGAAVTAAETPRLLPFIPTPTDSAKAIETKLQNFLKEYEQMNAELRQGRNLSQVIGPANPAGALGGAAPSRAEIEAEALRRGIRLPPRQ